MDHLPSSQQPQLHEARSGSDLNADTLPALMAKHVMEEENTLDLSSASRDSGMAPLTPSWSPSSVLGIMSLMRNKGRIADHFATALAVWILAFSAIIPSLDRDLADPAIAIEAENHESCGHLRHDHTICIQFGKQDWTSDSSLWLQVFPPTAGEAAPAVFDVPPEFPRLIPTHSRAPPHTT